MAQRICDYCGGSGRDAVTPSTSSCWKCNGMGSYWEQDPIQSTTPAPPGPLRRGGGGYRPLPYTQKLLDSVPKWLNWTTAAVGGVLGMMLGQAVDPSADVAMWVIGGLGALLGYAAIPLMIGLADLLVQLTMLVVKVALVLGIGAGLVYALSLLGD